MVGPGAGIGRSCPDGSPPVSVTVAQRKIFIDDLKVGTARLP
jgi:hypothetical protein